MFTDLELHSRHQYRGVFSVNSDPGFFNCIDFPAADFGNAVSITNLKVES
jgi:hypothetical protein